MTDESPSADGPAPNFVPLYQQVRDILVSRIAEGHWPPGTLLPAEPQLARELNVSPGTVRKALDELAFASLVTRRQGRGTFVAEQTPHSSLFQFFRVVDSRGQRVVPDSEEIARERGKATAEEARRLALSAGDGVLRLDRYRLLAGERAMVERVVVADARFAGLAETAAQLPNTLYDLYQRQFGVTIIRASESLRAIACDAALAERLGLAPGAPVLEIDRHAYSFNDVPIEWRLSFLDCRHFGYSNDIQ